jgi:hypothetical protein
VHCLRLPLRCDKQGARKTFKSRVNETIFQGYVRLSNWVNSTMKRDLNDFRVFLILVLFFLPLLGGCFHTGQPSGDDSVFGGSLSRIAVIPFQQIFPEDLTDGAVESPLTGLFFKSLKPLGSPECILETGFLKHLEKSRPELKVVAGERAAAVFRNVSSLSWKRSLRETLCETGRELGADLVVAGYLYRFRERKGESFAVEKPASVAFEIVMLRVDNGGVVWRGIFDRTQKSLLEDIFQFVSFLKGKGRWLKAEDLLEEGIGKVMETFPEFK